MTCLFGAGPDRPTGAEPSATDRPAGNLFTLFRLLRAFLTLNLAVGVCVILASAREGKAPDQLLVPGPLWLAANRDFTEVDPCWMATVVFLAGAMSSVMIWPRWWTAAIAVAAAAYWLWIGIWCAAMCAC